MMENNNQNFSFKDTENIASVSSKMYTIGGVPIKFPYKAYPSQITMMDKIIRGLNNKMNCLLESPTGSGKSLALLCATIAWQMKMRKEIGEMERDLEDNLNAYGAAVEDENLCPVHSVKTDQNTKHNNFSPSFHEEIEDLKPVPDSNTMNNNSYTCSVSTESDSLSSLNSESINFFDDDYKDFLPTKKFRKSLNQKDSPRIIKLGNGNNSPHRSNLKSSSLRLRKNKLTDDLKEELLNNSTATPKTIPPEPQTKIEDKYPLNICTCKQSCTDKIKKQPHSNSTLTKLPTIYYGTRTHKQLDQIIRELKKTTYKNSKMTVLSSRERTCVHPEASRADNKNEACDELLKAEGGPSCKYYRNGKTMSHCNSSKLSTAFDLEDFVKICKQMKACPYFGSRELLPAANIVFCPYNYLVDPLIRSAMSIKLKGSIVIMDEAHNIEDSARSAASTSFSLLSLEEGGINLEKVARHDRSIAEFYLYFADIFKNLASWIKSNSNNLTDYESFDSSCKVWSGDDMIAFLSCVKIGPEAFKEFCQKFEKVLSEETDSEKDKIIDMDKPKLLGSTLITLKNLNQILSFIYKNNLAFVPDYRCVIMKSRSLGPRTSNANRHAIMSHNRFEMFLHFWCLNPAVAFSDVKDNIYSLIVASGTLSPLSSFESELGISFKVTLEANHVISKSQIWVGTIGRGPNNVSLNAKFENSGTFAFQDDIGNLVLQICNIIPHGILCFVPSYSMMDKLVNRWQQTGLYSRLEALKEVFIEPRKNVDFLDVISEFYDCIKESETSKDKTGGALFLAVCRGKVSEGIDFTDNYARAVITIGIPYPHYKDPQVDLKKKYNDRYASQKEILSGSKWYEIQAFRAINQALGRCIRHRNDFGALIIVDERFQKNNNYCNNLSKWIRKEIEHFSSSKEAVTSLSFFVDKTGLRTFDPTDL